jgi:hypothetical protein
VDQPLGRRLGVEPERLDRHLARHLAGGVTTHAVGDGEERLGDEARVLVDRAHHAGVGGRPEPERRHPATSMTVDPIFSLSPRLIGTAEETLRVFRYVPLVDPRSST